MSSILSKTVFPVSLEIVQNGVTERPFKAVVRGADGARLAVLYDCDKTFAEATVKCLNRGGEALKLQHENAVRREEVLAARLAKNVNDTIGALQAGLQQLSTGLEALLTLKSSS